MGLLNRLFGGGSRQSADRHAEVDAPTPRQQVDGDGLSCRGWVEQIEPYAVPGVLPVELTVEPLPDGIRALRNRGCS